MRTFLYAILTFSYLSFNGCSVVMAISGEKNTDLSKLYYGQGRKEVVQYLGEPKTTEERKVGQKTDKYVFQWNNEPSIIRGATYLFLDVLTFGLWEFVGTPMEAMNSEKKEVIIEYNSEDKVQNFY